jgi:hypothetical protein
MRGTDAHEEATTGELIGAELVKNVLKARYPCKYPLFLITNWPEKAREALGDEAQSVIIKHKRTGAVWLAEEIIGNLKRLGIFVDFGRVFCVYGHDRTANAELSDWLRGFQLMVDRIEPGTFSQALSEGIVQRMNGCAAIIALCTADDRWQDGSVHPRQNVLLEIGMAMGLHRGPKRLIIVQRWGDDSLAQVLPTDLAGLLTLRFKERVSEVFDPLRSRLREVGVELRERV